MIRLGLTGSIGMGKSTTAEIFRALNVPIYDADAVVHQLYETDAVAPIAALFPDVVVEGRIDRKALSAKVVNTPKNMKALEEIVHPMVHAAEAKFSDEQAQKGYKLALFDIPLLFEGAREGQFDKILVVTAPSDIQRARVLARPNMTKAKFEAILKRQVPDEIKRQKADYIIDTSLGMDHAKQKVTQILEELNQLSQ